MKRKLERRAQGAGRRGVNGGVWGAGWARAQGRDTVIPVERTSSSCGGCACAMRAWALGGRGPRSTFQDQRPCIQRIRAVVCLSSGSGGRTRGLKVKRNSHWPLGRNSQRSTSLTLRKSRRGAMLGRRRRRTYISALRSPKIKSGTLGAGGSIHRAAQAGRNGCSPGAKACHQDVGLSLCTC